MWCLYDLQIQLSVYRSDLQAVIDAILDDLFPLKDNESGMRSHQCIVDAILGAATFLKDDGEGGTESMSFEDFKDLCGRIPSLRKYLGSLLSPPDPGTSPFRLFSSTIIQAIKKFIV